MGARRPTEGRLRVHHQRREDHRYCPRRRPGPAPQPRHRPSPRQWHRAVMIRGQDGVRGWIERERRVMLLWAASAGNEGASWIMLVAVFVYVLRHFPASSLAIVELVGTLPALLCMPFAGASADRRDVRRLAVGSMTVQALSLLGVLVMLRVGLWEVAACYGLQGAAGSVWPPARQRWLYALVREDRGRAAANAAIGSVGGVMTIAGAALGGILSAWSTR